MTRPQQPGAHVGGGFIVARIGHVMCGGCGVVIRNHSLGRAAHAKSCPELQKLRDAAERAFQRAHPEVQ